MLDRICKACIQLHYFPIKRKLVKVVFLLYLASIYLFRTNHDHWFSVTWRHKRHGIQMDKIDADEVNDNKSNGSATRTSYVSRGTPQVDALSSLQLKRGGVKTVAYADDKVLMAINHNQWNYRKSLGLRTVDQVFTLVRRNWCCSRVKQKKSYFFFLQSAVQQFLCSLQQNI